jgi:uroporphyrinogen decarboxylase
MAYRSRERVERVLNHREADRVPFCAFHAPFFDEPQPEIVELVDELGLSNDHRAMCLEGDFAGVRADPAPHTEIFRPFLGDIPVDAEISFWGYATSPLRTAEGYEAGNRIYHPLACIDTLEELKEFPFPDVIRSGADEGLEGKVAALKEGEYTVLGQMSATVLETAYYLRGIPRLMLDFYERPEYVDYLFARIAEQRIFQARRMAEAGVDILRIGDDIATQNSLLVSPALYRERIKPFHAAVIRSARTVNPSIRVKYHSDGALLPLLPDLIDIGVDIINPVQPECMDLPAIKKVYGGKLVLWGCMPVQSLFANGSRNDVAAHVDFLMEKIAPHGGMVIKFTNFLFTERSRENLAVFFEMFYEKGRYR